ncbi:unnamed protein product [Cuscuta campestris]|uniref:Uncharacterized protein n=1 Tax=Cuscuta campestris TaxID=132261 RepID=A0A484MHE9_9ASTE|nr:unnamed protein product [Cuscuta campestris]
MPSSLPALVSSYRSFIIQSVFAFSLALLLHFFSIFDLFLNGLFTYVHPDNVNPSSSSSSSSSSNGCDSELKPRKKPKQNFEFDENKAQIFQLKLIGSKREFISVSSRVLSFVLPFPASCCPGYPRNSWVLGNGSAVPVLLGCFVALCRVFLLLARTEVCFEECREAIEFSDWDFRVCAGADHSVWCCS